MRSQSEPQRRTTGTFDCDQRDDRTLHHLGQPTAGDEDLRVRSTIGDLVYFGDNPQDPYSIHHVGLYIGGGRMIEAPFTGASVREVRIARSDVFGFARP